MGNRSSMTDVDTKNLATEKPKGSKSWTGKVKSPRRGVVGLAEGVAGLKSAMPGLQTGRSTGGHINE